MMANKYTHEVVHPKLFLKVEGKLQPVPVGSQLLLTDKKAKEMGPKVRPIVESKGIDIDIDIDSPDLDKDKDTANNPNGSKDEGKIKK